MSKKLFLTYGISGSGKSTLAKKLAKEYSDSVILSTDDFWGEDYQWNPEYIGDAHKWNQGRCALAMFQGKECIVIDNTSLKSWTMYEYVRMAKDHNYEVSIVKPKTKWVDDPNECFKRGTHNVPLATIKRMAKEAENIKDIKKDLEAKFHIKLSIL